MRIVIDFLDHRGTIAPAALALVRDMVSQGDGHEVWVAVALRAPKAIETLRLGLAGLLPPQRVRAFALPPDGRSTEVVRQHALAELAPHATLLMAEPARNPRRRPAPALPTVVADARDASATYLWRQLAVACAESRPAPAPPRRPRLAYISPLPPNQSGIANYAAELVPALAQYYDIELVADQASVDDARLAAFPLRQVEWFRACAHQYERLLYHFGNSHAHRHMFELIREHPGVAVMHDFYYSGVLYNLECEHYLPHAFARAMYESHGYTGLLDSRALSPAEAVWKYPVSKGVIDHAAGVIVHSEFARQLARHWYARHIADDWRVVPLPKARPAGWNAPDTRQRARARLRLGAGDYLVCAFGMTGPTKLNDELVSAFLASRLAADPHCRLVFVGEHDRHEYGVALAARLAAAGARIAVTGYADPATYGDYLAAADCAVQLRAMTRGESSAAVLDCLLYGIPTIVNAHGSNAGLPDAPLVKLPDRFTTGELAAALDRLHADPTLRAELSGRAQAHALAAHAPERCARLYFDAIEGYARHGRHARYQALVREAAPLASASELPALAAAIAFNRAPQPPRQLLVDVSAMIETDLKTGIQRVVRSVLLALIAAPPPGWRIEPVFTTGGGNSYRYARRYGLRLVGAAPFPMEDAPVDLRPGDIFLGLDLFASGTTQNQDLLQSMRERGVGVHFAVYDLLPLLRPEVFPFGTEQYFDAYLRTVYAVSDGILCISRAVADELARWIAREGLSRRAPLSIGWFHLGADIDASAPSRGLPPDAAEVLAALEARPSFLMVGTVEPRKGHAQALAAFELLWAEGSAVNLVIVGKQGWMVEQLALRIGEHPELGKRLFWLAGISDEMLLKLYAGSAALLAPSEGEGFGLPLIEAAQHDIPIIARDLPVFREVAGEHACYFDGREPVDLAGTVAAWLELRREGKVPPSTGMPWLTWAGSAQQVLDALVRQRWYRILPGSGETT